MQLFTALGRTCTNAMHKAAQDQVCKYVDGSENTHQVNTLCKPYVPGLLGGEHCQTRERVSGRFGCRSFSLRLRRWRYGTPPGTQGKLNLLAGLHFTSSPARPLQNRGRRVVTTTRADGPPTFCFPPRLPGHVTVFLALGCDCDSVTLFDAHPWDQTGPPHTPYGPRVCATPYDARHCETWFLCNNRSRR